MWSCCLQSSNRWLMAQSWQHREWASSRASGCSSHSSSGKRVTVIYILMKCAQFGRELLREPSRLSYIICTYALFTKCWTSAKWCPWLPPMPAWSKARFSLILLIFKLGQALMLHEFYDFVVLSRVASNCLVCKISERLKHAHHNLTDQDDMVK